jgi:hypothetical protein
MNVIINLSNEYMRHEWSLHIPIHVYTYIYIYTHTQILYSHVGCNTKNATPREKATHERCGGHWRHFFDSFVTGIHVFIYEHSYIYSYSYSDAYASRLWLCLTSMDVPHVYGCASRLWLCLTSMAVPHVYGYGLISVKFPNSRYSCHPYHVG